jgi:hemerythrin superfamily protein
MNALDLMRTDHRQLRQLVERALEETQPERREACLATIRAEFAAHERMEEEVFYPALRRDSDAADIVLEGYEEHHVTDLILDELMEVAAGSDVWEAKLKVFKENVEHHIEEEEGEMFTKARKALGDDELEELGRRMASVKGESPTP